MCIRDRLLPYAVYTPEGSETETVVTLPEQTLPIVSEEMVRSKTLILDMTDRFESGIEITEDSLRAAANDYIKANPLGATIPDVYKRQDYYQANPMPPTTEQAVIMLSSHFYESRDGSKMCIRDSPLN